MTASNAANSEGDFGEPAMVNASTGRYYPLTSTGTCTCITLLPLLVHVHVHGQGINMPSYMYWCTCTWSGCVQVML